MRTTNGATRETGYRFTGNNVGVHTLIPMLVRRVDLCDQIVHVTATIGEAEDGTRRVEFDMTYPEAKAADIIEEA